MLQALIGAGLAGAGSLFSGLGARQSAASQQRHQLEYDKQARGRALDVMERWRDRTPEWLVQDAERAGFNPVTWLNAGALGHYDNMFGQYMGIAGTASQAINIPSAMSAVGGAISAAGSALTQGMQFDRKMDLEYASLGVQQDIASMRYSQSGGSHGSAGASASDLYAVSGAGGPVYKAGSQAGIQIGGGVTTASGGLTKKQGDLTSWDTGYKVNTTPDNENAAPKKLYKFLDPDPKMPNADSIEQEYGDVGGSVYGPFKVAADLYHTKTKRSAVDDFTEFFRDDFNKTWESTAHDWENMKSTREYIGNHLENFKPENLRKNILPFFVPQPGGRNGPKPIPQF